MREHWFRDRLTKAKLNAPMWTELADAIQEIFSDHVEPIIERLRGMGSAFAMAPEDLDRRVEELGPFFWMSERVEREDWPLALLQRQDEIHLKKTDYPLVSTIAREFSGMQVDWAPLYAPIDQKKWPYGTRFTTMEMMEFEDIPESQWFMTSRGVIRVPLPRLSEASISGSTIDDQCAEFEAILARFVTPVIPLHIVFDGAQYYLEYNLVEGNEWLEMLLCEISQSFPPVSEGGESADYSEAEITTTYPVMNGRDTQVRTNRLDGIPVDAYQMDAPL